MRLLVVEDDVSLAEGLVTTLTQAGYQVDCAGSVAEATLRLERQEFSLVILDLGLPDGDGIDILRALRRRKQVTPVLILSARDAVGERIRGLDHGADDYLTKPFAFDELLARVRALGRRGGAAVAGATLRYADVEMDRVHHRVTRGGRPLDLTAREFRLLEYFLVRPDEVVSRTELLEKVWDMSFDPGSNVVDVHVSNLRGKLEEGNEPRLIQTVRGVGFALRTEET